MMIIAKTVILAFCLMFPAFISLTSNNFGVSTLRNDAPQKSGDERYAYRSLWSQTTKTIDGFTSYPEWMTNFNQTISSSPPIVIGIENDAGSMYMRVLFRNQSLTSFYGFGIMFDAGDSSVFAPTGEPQFTFSRLNGQWMFMYANSQLFNSGSSTGTPNLPMPSGCSGAIVRAGQDVSLEMQISLASLAVIPGGTIPFFMTASLMNNQQLLYPSNPYTLQGWAPIHLSTMDVHAPVLSSPQFTASVPRIDQLCNFSIKFSDADNNAPDSVSLVLDGSGLAMSKQNPTNNNYISGCTYQILMYLKPGMHNYYFTTAEGLFVARYPASSNLTTPSITSINQYAPTLANGMVNLASTTNFTTIVYTVLYSDQDNNPPSTINVVIDGIASAMIPSIANPTNFIEGILYRYETRLPIGSHVYFFNCSDGLHVARAPTTSTYSGPTITAGSPSALFDGAYVIFELPSGLLPSQLSSITKLKYVHALLPNGTYFVQIYGYADGFILLEDCNENPQTGIVTNVHSYLGSSLGGGAFINSGQRDTSWIPLNSTLGSTYLFTFGNPQLNNFTATGQGWVTYGIYNRSCWIFTDVAHSTSLYYDKATGVFMKAIGTSGEYNTYIYITMEETNVLDFHEPIVNSLIVTPGTGSGTTLFNFTANVGDYDGILPSQIELFIDGQTYMMISAMSSATADQIVHGVDFSMFSVLPTGTHQYYLTAYDGRYTARYPTSGSFSIIVSGPDLSPPVLSNGTAIPFKGNQNNLILFLVKYADADNNPPASINATINGIDRPLQKLQPTDLDMIDGSWYFTKVSLPAGVYNYHFNANDGRFTAHQPLAGDLQANITATLTTPRLFTGAEALYNVTLIGNFDVTFTGIGPSMWSGQENSLAGNDSFTFNETTRIISNTDHGGLFGNPGCHVTYIIPQNVVLGSHVLISDVGSGSSLDQNCTVVDATVKFVGNDPRACWVLQNVADSRDTWYYEESTGFLMGGNIFIKGASGAPVSDLTVSMVSTNIFIYHSPLLQVHQVPSGLLSDALSIIINMTYQDLDNYKPVYFRIHLNNTVINAFAAGLFLSNTWAEGVTVLYQAYLSPGTYSYWIEYSDGVHVGRYPSVSNGTFTLIFVNNLAPVLSAALVSPNQTHAFTMPIFLVKYSDADNNPPTNISVKIDGVKHNCIRLNPSGSDYVDGVEYCYQSAPLALGLHTYMFSATDGAHVTNTSVFSGPRIQANMINLTAFDGMFVDWQYSTGTNVVTGRDTYAKLLTIYNVTETITGNPLLKGQRIEFNNSIVASDTSLFGLHPGSNSMFWHPTNIILSPGSTITLNETNAVLVCHQTSAGIYQFNGKYLPVWFYSSGSGDQLVVDQHTGIILHLWNPTKSFNYSVMDSNAFNLYTPTLSSPQVTPGSGIPSTLFTFRINATDGNGIAPAVTLVLNSLRYSMNLETPNPNFKQGATFGIALYMQPGTWNYHFEASDHFSTVSTGNQTIGVTPVAIHVPVIVSNQVTPTRGDNYTWFEFSMIYSDQDNNKPQHVIVTINGTNHPMIQANVSDTNFMNGVQFIYATQLAAAPHDYVYYYNASNNGITNVISPGNGSYGNLFIRPGTPTILASDVGYEVKLVSSFAPPLFANYTYTHKTGNNFLASVTYSFAPPGNTFVVNNLTRVMSNYTGYGNFFYPQNSIDTFFIPRDVHNGSLVTFSSGNGTVQVPVAGSTIISILGMQFHAWIINQGNLIAWYDMESGFLLGMIITSSSSFVILTPVYGTMFHNYYLPSLLNANLVNPSGNSTVQRQFTITFQDGDNVLPGRHQVIINGTAFTMVPLNPLDLNVTRGKVYVLKAYFQPGTYQYFYKFSDNLTTVRYPPASNGTFTVSAANNYPPVLTTPSISPQNGYNDTRFVFNVNYADLDNNAPVYFNVTLNGIDHLYHVVLPLMPVNSSNTYYVGGTTWMTYIVNLTKGNYSYSFSAYDGRFTRATLAKYFLVNSEAVLNKASLANMTIGIISNSYGGNNPTNYGNLWNDMRARNVKTLQLQGPITADFLASIDLLWFDQNGGGQFSAQDITLITNWIAAGGCAIIVGTYYSYIATQVLNAYNIQTFNNSIPGGTASVSSQHPIVTGVSSMAFGSQYYMLDLSRASTAFMPVVTLNGVPEIVAYQNARNGKIVIISDNSIFNNYYAANNRLFSNNTFGWFAQVPNFFNCTIQSNGTTPVSPTSATPVTFKAKYFDLDNHRPVFVNITIDGLTYPMKKQNATDYNFNTGVYYQYTTYLQNGTHFYTMEGADGSITARTVSTPLVVSLVDNYLPIITTWLITNTSHLYTDFAYVCNYTDRDNNAPRWVKLSIDGQPSVLMQQINASANDYIAGVLYYYNTTLGIGTHSWYVTCTDNGTIVRSPSTGSKSGPLVLSLNAINGVYDGLVYNWTLGYSSGGSYNYTTFFKQINGNLYNITTFEYGFYGQGRNTFTAIVDIGTRNAASTYSSQKWFGPMLAQVQEPEFWFIPRGMTKGNSIDIWSPMNGFANYTVRWLGIIYSPPMKSYFQALILQDSFGDILVYDQKTGFLLFISSSNANVQATWCEAFNNNNLPTLKSPSMAPTSGNQDNAFLFTITYTDADSNPPTHVQLFIDGLPLEMQRNPGITNYAAGCIYHLQAYLQNGTHSYWFYASDGLFNATTLHFSTPLIGYVNNLPPTLSGTSLVPLTGFNYTVYTFSTTYADPDNNAPAYVRVNFNGTNYNLAKVNASDTDYIAGALYSTSIVIHKEGLYRYFMVASDGLNQVRSPLDPSQYYIGPNVTTSLFYLQNYTMQSRSYTWEPTNMSVPISSNSYTMVIGLPFTFKMYDQSFTKLTISMQDAFIRMGVFDQYDSGRQFIPSTALQDEYIIGCDIQTGVTLNGGFVRYANLTSPNRVVVEFDGINNKSLSNFNFAPLPL